MTLDFESVFIRMALGMVTLIGLVVIVGLGFAIADNLMYTATRLFVTVNVCAVIYVLGFGAEAVIKQVKKRIAVRKELAAEDVAKCALAVLNEPEDEKYSGTYCPFNVDEASPASLTRGSLQEVVAQAQSRADAHEISIICIDIKTENRSITFVKSTDAWEVLCEEGGGVGIGFLRKRAVALGKKQ